MASWSNSRRRMGRDEQEQEFRDLLDDPESSFGDILAAAIEACPPDKLDEVHGALRGLGEDRRGPHSWAADRMERRRLGRDALRHRPAHRFGRDDPPPFPQLAVCQQPGIGCDRRAAKLQQQTTVEIDPQRTLIRFTRRVPHCDPLGPLQDAESYIRIASNAL